MRGEDQIDRSENILIWHLDGPAARAKVMQAPDSRWRNLVNDYFPINKLKASYVKLQQIKYIGAVLALVCGAASAQVTHIDLAPYANFQMNWGGAGATVGNAGTSISSTTFNLLDSTRGNHLWVGGSTGDAVDIQTNVFGATSVQTLLNSFWGQAGMATVSLEFKGSAGASQNFTLYGGSDIRDWNPGGTWTTTINGTTTQEWHTFGNGGARLDAQTFALNSSFATQTLTDIVITARNASYGYSQVALSGVNVVAAPVPEPETLALMLAGLSVVAMTKRRRVKQIQV